MPITDSRNKVGTLTIDAIAFATQMTNVRLEPSTDEEGDELETLSGDVLGADDVTTWNLVIVAVQDFDDPDGFIAYAMANAGDLVPIIWTPNADPGTVSYALTARVRPVPVGGDVASRLTTTATWPVEGAPTPTYIP